MTTKRHVTLRLLVLIVGVCLISGMSSTSSNAQRQDPIAKEGLLKSLSRKVLSSRELIEQVEQRGVDFQLTSTDEKQIRRAGKYLGNKGLDDLITELKRNYRSSVSSRPALTTKTPPQLEEPTFRERPAEMVTVFIGSMGARYTYDELTSRTGTPMLVSGFVPVRLHVRDGRLYVDVSVTDGESPIEIKNNEFVVRRPDWDKNSNRNALEIVDRNNKPVFQLIYKSPTNIQINGIFVVKGRALIAKEGLTINSPTAEEFAAFSLKPIFKYPSWKYPGQYADETPAPSPSSINQTMTNSPGGIQAGGDVVIKSDRRLIQSLVLAISVDIETPEKEITEVQTDVGLQSVIALFTKETRIRFVTDFKLTDQQVSPRLRRLRFIYTPESPNEIQGKEVRFLESIDALAVNYADIFQTLQFALNNEPVALRLTVVLNGLEVGSFLGKAVPGVLARGQASMDVSALFSQIPTAYDKAVSR